MQEDASLKNNAESGGERTCEMGPSVELLKFCAEPEARDSIIVQEMLQDEDKGKAILKYRLSSRTHPINRP